MEEKVFKVAQRIVNSRAYPYLLGAFIAFVFAYIIVKGL